ncbi:RsmB/NOP family class I SAM-dependent RNA methyltransferase [Gynuella sunshinyii]|uniref:tRNA and rRNA cytosine-C5-methylase n=1 Tax=Gynuella sunshinyii YC6258 TaxID=1445510 RepID=A0A0C5V9B3_9GAMM|nr:RsmB/NOP family class I SAM-dependent RNA methyltransferase [Gynuella sunshinyii]AJQ95960.1 tRNA and rRNA cytosine-C5-methylase [Gynuella sunshinyii YC6258]
MSWAPFRYPFIFKIWDAYLQEGNWYQLDRWLKSYYQGQSRFGKKDRKAYSDAMFAAMRYLQLAAYLQRSYLFGEQDLSHWSQQWRLDELKSVPIAEFWYWIGLRLNHDIPPPRELNDGPARREHFLKLLHQCETDETLWLLFNGFSPELEVMLHQRCQTSQWNRQRFKTFVELNNTSAPVWLRVNVSEDLMSLQSLLADEGIATEAENGGLKLTTDGRVTETITYQQGHIDIQDFASQQIAAAVDVQPGMRVWDACTGGGGKALAVAGRMNNQGMVVASDVRAYKLESVSRRARRMGIRNIQTEHWDAHWPDERLPSWLMGEFDRILIDAPCSGSGTWRRAPDFKWRIGQNELDELLDLQGLILDRCVSYLKPGGQLIYATCSWFCQENEQQVENFLRRHPHMQLQQQALHGAPDVDSDTMFSAVMVSSLPASV